MMNIILCEGKTDAILISYFLESVHEYRYSKKEIVKLPVEKSNEAINWYVRKEQKTSLAIWAVGGYDRLRRCLADIISRNESESHHESRFDKIVLIFDRDKRTDVEISTSVSAWLDESRIKYATEIGIDTWMKCFMRLKKNPPEDYPIDVLPLVIPPEGDGALETFLLNSLREIGEEEGFIVGESRQYMEKIKNVRYLNKSRFREKACLGSVLSVFSPDWVFTNINDRIRSVRWEEIRNINKAFRNFERL